MNANDTILYLINLLLFYMEELKDVSNSPYTQFAYGEKTAFTECLEILQEWNEAPQNGLDFNIEKKYPL